MNFKDRVYYHRQTLDTFEYLADGYEPLKLELHTLSGDMILKLQKALNGECGTQLYKLYSAYKEKNQDSCFADWVDSL